MPSFRVPAIAFGIGLSLAVTFGQATAQGVAKPAPSPAPFLNVADLLLDPLEVCGLAVEDFDNAGAALTERGWAVDPPLLHGPYIAEVTASVEYTAGVAYYYASIENYATASIGYCEYEIDNPSVAIDLNHFADDFDLVGEVTQDSAGQFGVWQVTDNNETYFILAYVTPEIYHFQLSWFGPVSSVGPGPKTSPPVR